MPNVLFLFYKYLFSYKKENRRLTFYLGVIFYALLFLLMVINSFTNGLIKIVEKSIFNGYGHIHIELSKKLYCSEIAKDSVISQLKNYDKVEKIDIYGILPGMVKYNTFVLPAYLISYYQNSFDIDEKKRGCFVGKVMYDRYKNSYYKKLFLPIKENEKKSILQVSIIPISFAGGLFCAWDEWNERAIFFSAKKLEKYLEKPSLYLLNMYLKNYHYCDEVVAYIDSLKNKSIIKYYKKSIDLLPEYNKFYSLVMIIHSIINAIVIFFSFLIIMILLFLYINNNREEWLLLWYSGISRFKIINSILLVFLFIYGISGIFSFLSGAGIVFCINYFKLIIINQDSSFLFICQYDFFSVIKYFVYTFMILIFILYFLLQRVFILHK